jgi:hypothetical protein
MMIEAVRSTLSTADLELLVWSKGNVSVQPDLLRCGELFVPPRIGPGLATAIRFPIAKFSGSIAEVFSAAGICSADGLVEMLGANDIGSAESLIVRKQFLLLQHIASKFVTVDTELLPLVIAYVFYTWVADRFTQAPYLSIVGPLGSGKTELLRFLNCCCRRPLLLSDISVAGLYSLTDRLAPTLLIDEADFGRDIRSRELARLLRAGHTAEGVAFRGGRAYNLFSPKVICSRTPLPDAALASRAIEISMSRCTADPELRLCASSVAALLGFLQPQLLRFRLRNYDRELSVKPDLSSLSARSRDLARALAGPFVDCPDVQELIIEKLRRREPDAMARQSDEPELIVLEAFFTQLHIYHEPYVTVGIVSKWANGLLGFRKEHPRFEPRGVGPILRQLGFSTQTIGSHGIGMYITNDIRERLHRHATTYGIIPAGKDCQLCVKVRNSDKKSQSAKQE